MATSMDDLKKKILDKLEHLSDNALNKVLDFVDFLEWQHQNHQLIFSSQTQEVSTCPLQPDNVITFCQLGKIRLQLHEYQEAIHEFNQALQINPNFAEVYYYRGKSHNKLNNKQSAIVDFKTAAKIFCENNESEKLANWTPFELGESNREEAIPYLIQYLSLTSSYENKRLAASAINKLASSFMKSCELAVPSLLDNLSDSAPQVRQYCLKALNAMSLPKYTIPRIQEIAENDPKEYNRKIAQAILNRLL